MSSCFSKKIIAVFSLLVFLLAGFGPSVVAACDNLTSATSVTAEVTALASSSSSAAIDAREDQSRAAEPTTPLALKSRTRLKRSSSSLLGVEQLSATDLKSPSAVTSPGQPGFFSAPQASPVLEFLRTIILLI